MVEKLCVVTADNDFLANLCSYYLNTYMFFLIAVHMPNEKSKYDVRFICFNLFVGGHMSYLRCLCLFMYSGVQHILCVVLLFCFSSSCVPYVANCSGFSNFDWSFGILERLFYLSWNIWNIINSCRPTEYLICIFVFCLTKLNQQISMSSPLTESFNLEPWSPGNTCLFTGRLPLQSVHITTKVVSSNPAQAMCTRYNVMW